MASSLISGLRAQGRKPLRLLVDLARRISGRDTDDFIRFLFESYPLRPETIIQGYCNGFFPMPGQASGQVHWCAPRQRGVLPIDGVHIEKGTRRIAGQGRFRVTLDTAFQQVIDNCAMNANRQNGSWITSEIIDAYTELHHMGMAHSVEVWQEERLVGGMYGITLGSYFAGESQFHLVDNAGKVGFYRLCQGLHASGFMLHDIQHVSPHLQQLGGYAIPRSEFKRRLHRALVHPARLALTTESS
jgi:leucyl/phenylalanyl-tRNA--protein transferase